MTLHDSLLSPQLRAHHDRQRRAPCSAVQGLCLWVTMVNHAHPSKATNIYLHREIGRHIGQQGNSLVHASITALVKRTPSPSILSCIGSCSLGSSSAIARVENGREIRSVPLRCLPARFHIFGQIWNWCEIRDVKQDGNGLVCIPIVFVFLIFYRDISLLILHYTVFTCAAMTMNFLNLLC